MIDVHIPKFGMSTVEVDVTEVLVTPGDRVQVGTPLITIETEKAQAVIESEHVGTVVEVLVKVDEVYEVGDVFCRVELDA
jgi:pyruvate/2-oxoglutarate dehydrogenase complex dihydrolipoamide acyltransferase (E2) component